MSPKDDRCVTVTFSLQASVISGIETLAEQEYHGNRSDVLRDAWLALQEKRSLKGEDNVNTTSSKSE